ncbi:hypothetical protein K1719_017798 [Acacia pycnantha]|nr:hypothetical protein K1719_017798 [Acacia pycnantha]
MLCIPNTTVMNGLLKIQETKWSGERSRREINGFKLWYTRKVNGRNGIGIITDNEWRKNVVEVKRVEDIIISLRMIVGKETINIIRAGSTSSLKPSNSVQMDSEEEYFVQWLKMRGELVAQLVCLVVQYVVTMDKEPSQISQIIEKMDVIAAVLSEANQLFRERYVPQISGKETLKLI